MESTLVTEFINRTACDTLDIAYLYLQNSNWDVETAVKSYYDAVNGDFAEYTRKLSRGISRATDNVQLVSDVRNELAERLEHSYQLEASDIFDIPKYTFTLPDLSVHEQQFQNFLEKELIDNSALSSLESAGRLNWWDLGPMSKLWPLATTGDGNCLLHAASLSMWGFHDRMLVLRRALHKFFQQPSSESLKRRWRWQMTKSNARVGFCYTEQEWDMEWQVVVDMASPERRRDSRQGAYEGLEEIHILALAHVLRRAVIIISDTMLRDSNNEPFAPIPFGGIYLPFDCNPKDCHSIPLFLSYDMAHFSALVCMENESLQTECASVLIPLVTSQGSLLPVQFCVDPGVDFNWAAYNDNERYLYGITEKEQMLLLKAYMDVVDLKGNSSDVDSEEEIEKHFSEALDFVNGDQNIIFGNKNKAAKQLQSLGKQFGSIGRSMSKTLKKNFGSLGKLSKNKKSEFIRTRMICAEISLKRDAMQRELIKNYMKYAQQKFLLQDINNFATKSTDDFLLKTQAIKEGPLPCITNDCPYYGTVLTSYMCSKCFQIQKNELNEITKGYNNESHFGVGRSTFYSEPDEKKYETVKNAPNVPDATLHLSNSTFYADYLDNNNYNLFEMDELNNEVLAEGISVQNGDDNMIDAQNKQFVRDM